MRALRRSEFGYIRKQGKSVYGAHLAIDIAPITFKRKDQKSLPSKLALSVSKKMGKSPQRALFKRRVREVFRHLYPRILGPIYLHVRPVRHLKDMPSVSEIAADFEKLAPMRLPHIIVRHRRENKKKCTLTPLEKRPDCLFIPYPNKSQPPKESLFFFSSKPELLEPAYLKEKGYALLCPGAPPLTLEHRNSVKGLILIDCIWRYAEKMHTYIDPQQILPTFSLPQEIVTAYPRKQEEAAGLASIEALFSAGSLLGWNADGDLDEYYWKEAFLEKNSALPHKLCPV